MAPLRKTRLAIFDIDGTIFRSSLLIELFHELVRTRVFPKTAAAAVHKDYLRWLDRKGHYNDYLIRLVQTHYRYLRGCRERDVQPAINRVIQRQTHRVYRYTRDLVSTLKQKGYFLLAVSNSQETILQKFAERLGFHAALGRALQVHDGIYTGRISIAGKLFPITSHIDKVAVLKHYLAEQGIVPDLEHSIAVGDSEGDIPLLAVVGNPIAFNPSLPLAKYARQRGWRIVIERKDVIYDVRDTAFIPHNEHQRVAIPYGKRTR